jgi:hypothetical protein
LNFAVGDGVDSPATFRTITSTWEPGAPAGLVATMDAAGCEGVPGTFWNTAVFSPNRTLVTSSRLLPVMTTCEPPVAGPESGDTDVTVGSSPKFRPITEPQVVSVTDVVLL